MPRSAKPKTNRNATPKASATSQGSIPQNAPSSPTPTPAPGRGAALLTATGVVGVVATLLGAMWAGNDHSERAYAREHALRGHLTVSPAGLPQFEVENVSDEMVEDIVVDGVPLLETGRGVLPSQQRVKMPLLHLVSWASACNGCSENGVDAERATVRYAIAGTEYTKEIQVRTRSFASESRLLDHAIGAAHLEGRERSAAATDRVIAAIKGNPAPSNSSESWTESEVARAIAKRVATSISAEMAAPGRDPLLTSEKPTF